MSVFWGEEVGVWDVFFFYGWVRKFWVGGGRRKGGELEKG